MTNKNNELYNDPDFDIFIDGDLDSFDHIMAADGESRLEDDSIPQSDIEWERERWNSVYNPRKTGKFNPEVAQKYAECMKKFREWEKKLLESKKLTCLENKEPTNKYFPGDFKFLSDDLDDVNEEHNGYDNIPF